MDAQYVEVATKAREMTQREILLNAVAATKPLCWMGAPTADARWRDRVKHVRFQPRPTDAGSRGFRHTRLDHRNIALKAQLDALEVELDPRTRSAPAPMTTRALIGVRVLSHALRRDLSALPFLCSFFII